MRCGSSRSRERHLIEPGAEDWPGFDTQGSRLFEFCDVFNSVEVAKRYVADGIGWDDMRWLKVAGHRWVGATRGLHCWSSVEQADRVCVRLTQDVLIDDSWNLVGEP